MRTADHCFRFTRAIVRTPPLSAVDGLRAVDRGAPDVATMREHHARYVDVLRGLGVVVETLDAEEAFPDSLFVEDSALCLPEGAVVLRPGAATRAAEADLIEPVLRRHYADVRRVAGPGTVDGGDVLVTGSEIVVGRSARTDAQGVAELAAIVTDWGHSLREVVTPPGVLHLKTHCALLDADTILTTRVLARSGCFNGYRVVEVDGAEEPAANCIRVNDAVLMPEGFPRTADTVREAGFAVITVPNDECARIDGGLSCLSLRFTPPR